MSNCPSSQKRNTFWNLNGSDLLRWIETVRFCFEIAGAQKSWLRNLQNQKKWTITRRKQKRLQQSANWGVYSRFSKNSWTRFCIWLFSNVEVFSNQLAFLHIKTSLCTQILSLKKFQGSHVVWRQERFSLRGMRPQRSSWWISTRTLVWTLCSTARSKVFCIHDGIMFQGKLGLTFSPVVNCPIRKWTLDCQYSEPDQTITKLTTSTKVIIGIFDCFTPEKFLPRMIKTKKEEWTFLQIRPWSTITWRL